MLKPAMQTILSNARGHIDISAQRILVIGNSGSGKSTLTRKLARERDLPAIHLDLHFWRPGWISQPEEEFRETVKQLVETSRWIMDGNFSSTLDLRIPRADLIVLCNVDRVVCLQRAVIRMLKARAGASLYSIAPNISRALNYARPDMAPGCQEKFDWEFYNWIWHYPVRALPKTAEALHRFNAWDRTVVVDAAGRPTQRCP
jgi:adenylate kinase family enzyme